MTVEEALVVVERILPQGRLSKIQAEILRQSWDGKSYTDIALASDYDAGYVKDVGSHLWQLLSQVLGEKVTKHNFRGVLQRFIQREVTSTQPLAPVSPLILPKPSTAIAHNLPVRDFSRIIGRDRELAQLLEALTFDCPTHCISIEGIGGMGKTTLTLSAAYHYLHATSNTANPEPDSFLRLAPTFEAIIFTSAKQERLTPQGVLPRLKPERSLRDVFRAIARTLKCSDILLMDFEEQIEQIQDALNRQSTLLIVDNLETLEDWRSILAFLYDLPSTVKVVITSRQQFSFHAIRLEPLPPAESFSLIQQQVQSKSIVLGSTDVQTLHHYTSGVPAAIIYAIGQLAAGYPVKHLPSRLTLAVGDYAHFYFQSSMSLLQGTLPHYLLMALALSPGSAPLEAIAHIAGSDNLAHSMEGLAQLLQLSLVNQQAGRYSILALTREYALAELATHPNFEQAARNRWINWFLSYVQQHGGKDSKEWQEYPLLDQEWDNLQAVIEWCIASDRYDEMRQLWQQVNSYTHTQGYRKNRLNVWNTRLDWADWLIQAAEQRQDWFTALEVMLDQGWTLTLLGQSRHLEQAHTLYQKAWEQRHYQTLNFQAELAINIAVLRIQQRLFVEATDWLQQAQQLLSRAAIETSMPRSQIQIWYYQGEVAYKTENYNQAHTLFQQVLAQAEYLDWQRAKFLAKDWLADIAIQQQHFSEAQHLLEEGLQAATTNQDTCRVAFCERSLARLEKARGNGAIAQHWAATAKHRFEELGMLTEAKETAVLLQTLV
ncbi:ATP-binding protein [Trichocoleus desertorum AS-A10]|uniref:ATP-binding protein n=1 Tax=Trichocoleus desertorum TaxID=1481672 RepID=UPI003297E1AC